MIKILDIFDVNSVLIADESELQREGKGSYFFSKLSTLWYNLHAKTSSIPSIKFDEF